MIPLSNVEDVAVQAPNPVVAFGFAIGNAPSIILSLGTRTRALFPDKKPDLPPYLSLYSVFVGYTSGYKRTPFTYIMYRWLSSRT
jgi:hypothetical protein